MELFVNNETDKNLVSFEEWKQRMESIKSSIKSSELAENKVVENEDDCIFNVSESLVDAVSSRARSRLGIFFSGGVDSTTLAFLCKQIGIKFSCYSVGLSDSQDLEWSKRISRYYDFDLIYKEYTLDEAEDIIKRSASLLLPKVNAVSENNNPAVTVGVGSVIMAARELSENNYFFSGLGSEEIFAGYERHALAKDINSECWNGLVNMWSRDLVRDFTLCKELKMDVVTPYLDKDLITDAMKVPGHFKIVSEVKKMILRKAAINLGLDEEFAMRPKRAAQYGSGFDKAIEKLASRKGLNKGDYLRGLV